VAQNAFGLVGRVRLVGPACEEGKDLIFLK
jgi:hypothetical protein